MRKGGGRAEKKEKKKTPKIIKNEGGEEGREREREKRRKNQRYKEIQVEKKYRNCHSKVLCVTRCETVRDSKRTELASRRMKGERGRKRKRRKKRRRRG